jgi:hypothetical protein
MKNVKLEARSKLNDLPLNNWQYCIHTTWTFTLIGWFILKVKLKLFQLFCFNFLKWRLVVIENKWPFQGGDLVNNAMKRKMHDICVLQSQLQQSTSGQLWEQEKYWNIMTCVTEYSYISSNTKDLYAWCTPG